MDNSKELFSVCLNRIETEKRKGQLVAVIPLDGEMASEFVTRHNRPGVRWSITFEPERSIEVIK